MTTRWASGWLDRIYAQVDARASRADHAEYAARRALLTGVYLSGATLVLGLVITLAQGEVRPNDPPTLSQFLHGVLDLRGVCLVYAGLLLLAATPILRVVVMVAVYVRRREWFMAIVSVVVLTLLAVGVLMGTG